MIPTLGIPDVDSWRIIYHVANVGGSRAYIEICQFGASFISSGVRPEDNAIERIPDQEPFLLESGEDRRLEIDLGESITHMFRIMGGIRALYLEHQETANLYFWGEIHYLDENRVARNVSVFRHFQTDTAKFKPSDDTDSECSD